MPSIVILESNNVRRDSIRLLLKAANDSLGVYAFGQQQAALDFLEGFPDYCDLLVSDNESFIAEVTKTERFKGLRTILSPKVSQGRAIDELVQAIEGALENVA